MMRGIVVGVVLAGSLVAQPAEVATLSTPAPARFFVLAKTGKVAAAVCLDQKLRVWALPEGRVMRTIDTGKRVDHIAISSDGGRIAAAGLRLHPADDADLRIEFIPIVLVLGERKAR